MSICRGFFLLNPSLQIPKFWCVPSLASVLCLPRDRAKRTLRDLAELRIVNKVSFCLGVKMGW